MKKHQMPITAALAIFLVFAAVGAPHESRASEIVPHKAFYSLKIGDVRQGSSYVGAGGHMSLTMERTCDGWSLSQTLRLDLTTPEGDVVTQDIRFAAWESDDGTRYRFFDSSNVNGERKDFRGRARLNSPGGAGDANYRIPEGQKIPLPRGTLFPLGHTFWLIDRAEAGDRQASATVFDGATGEPPQQVSAFIGQKLPADGHLPKRRIEALGPLTQRPGWNMRLGFYELDSTRAAPDYEVEILQLDNGVSPLLVLDYQDFSVIMTQQSVEEIPPPRCQ